ncbi:MAG: TetR/AcrR family transcriptional regulator [Culicoidibacterales bacterium]
MEVAMDYFSNLGYTATSFALIAEAVGIKKQSIYAHFESKEQLYFTCFERAMLIENHRAKQYLQQLPKELEIEQAANQMKQYIINSQSQKSVLFLYRAGFFAPQKYKMNNKKYISEYREIILSVFRPLIFLLVQNTTVSDVQVKELVETLFCLYDGCIVELILNGNQAFQQRFESAWALFWGSIVQKMG